MIIYRQCSSFLIKHLPALFSTSESYESRKEIKRLQKTNDSFKIADHKPI